MAGRILKHGDVVLTPEGRSGRVLQRSKNPFFERSVYTRYDLDGEGDVLVYTVMLDSGEVRQYSFEALEAANRTPSEDSPAD